MLARYMRIAPQFANLSCIHYTIMPSTICSIGAKRCLSSHCVPEVLSPEDLERLSLYKDKKFIRSTHFPVEQYVDFSVKQSRKLVKMYSYKYPAQGIEKAVIALL